MEQTDSIEQEELLRETFEAHAALLFYETFGGYDAKRFVMRHDIVEGRLTEGRPLTSDALLELCAVAMPEIKSTVSFIPPELLAFTPGHDRGMMAWWRPAQIRHLYFHKSTGIPSGPAPVPSMLFMVLRGRLSVWVLDATERPEQKASVYHSPFFNTMGTGVCLGNMRLPATATPADMLKWERAYWRSAFTLEGPPRLKGIEGAELWKKLIKEGRKKFPAKHLKPCGKTVKQILEDA